MTVEKLIEKLENDKTNGAFAVFDAWNKELKSSALARSSEKDPIKWIALGTHIREVHYSMVGFIWGLYAVQYISHDDLFALEDNLCAKTSA